MTTREQFLGAIGKALGRTALPAEPARPDVRHSVHTGVMKDWSKDDLARAFIEYSGTIGARTVETTREELNAAVRNAVDACGPGPVVLADDPLLDELRTADALAGSLKVHVWDTDESREKNVLFAEKAAVGIAVAEMALAESATVLLFSHRGCGRSVTLLPESVIYIIPKSCIHPRLTQGMEFLRRLKDALPSSVNFVSGPSATSDIELVRVVGVHGPVHVFHIVVRDM
jgi:L-lactate dehydrogenase complex protein LldG